jgi:cytidyltransferase-like protein
MNSVHAIKWTKKNYGGKPTNNQDKKRAIFIGRYQPYHYGHIELIRQKLNDGIPVLIMIRDIEPDANNPFTSNQTKNMIEKYHASRNEDVKVIIIPDIESVNFGRGVGYEINKYTPSEEISNISATYIRECIKSGEGNWRNLVPIEIQEDVFSKINSYG